MRIEEEDAQLSTGPPFATLIGNRGAPHERTKDEKGSANTAADGLPFERSTAEGERPQREETMDNPGTCHPTPRPGSNGICMDLVAKDHSNSDWLRNSVSNWIGQTFCCANPSDSNAHSVVMLTPRRGRKACDVGFLGVLEFEIAGFSEDSHVESEKVDRHITQEFQGAQSNPLRMQLLSAVRDDDAPAVLQHVADGADVPLLSEAIRLASHRGSAAVVRELVAVGLCVNMPCPKTKFTPLQLACASGHHVVCEVLLDALADVHMPIGNITPLNLARRSGHAEVEEVIARHITSLVMADGDGETSSHTTNRRAHVLPRVSPYLSEAVLQAMPASLQEDMDVSALEIPKFQAQDIAYATL